MDGIEVYLRLKPVAADETEIVEIHSDRAIIISPYVAARQVEQRNACLLHCLAHYGSMHII